MYQLDDWWYYVGSPSGTSLWEDTPDAFPNTLAYTYKQMGRSPLMLQNGYLSCIGVFCFLTL